MFLTKHRCLTKPSGGHGGAGRYSSHTLHWTEPTGEGDLARGLAAAGNGPFWTFFFEHFLTFFFVSKKWVLVARVTPLPHFSPLCTSVLSSGL